MTLATFLILIAIGLLAGSLGGILGIGGGLLIIPGLTIFAKLNQHTAIGTSLAVMLPPIGLFAAYNYYKAGAVNLPYAMIVASAFMIGSFFSSYIALALPEVLVRR
ncbi:MAG: TSUP family transporter, partial [Spirochaetes bacterium]|nr:TSUP family transporter [Spirochaetota bacterium]